MIYKTRQDILPRIYTYKYGCERQLIGSVESAHVRCVLMNIEEAWISMSDCTRLHFGNSEDCDSVHA
jgi:hypothetical protein